MECERCRSIITQEVYREGEVRVMYTQNFYKSMEITDYERVCGRLKSCLICTCPFCLRAILQSINANSGEEIDLK
jgi:hypothetical protein